MTYKDALIWCDDFRNNIVMTGVVKEKYTLALQAMRTAMTAIAKQIPQKTDRMTCPNCGRIFLMLHGQTKGADFCDCCGQAIDWGEEDGK